MNVPELAKPCAETCSGIVVHESPRFRRGRNDISLGIAGCLPQPMSQSSLKATDSAASFRCPMRQANCRTAFLHQGCSRRWQQPTQRITMRLQHLLLG
jgi:hypothetical protein